MEEQKGSLFELQVDPVSIQHLQDAARWGKFLSIVGFIMIGLLVLLGVVMGTVLSLFSGSVGAGFFLGAKISVFYVAFAFLYFFPCLYLFRFAKQVQAAFRTNDQESLIDGFGNLKSCLKFVGILTIVAIVLYLFFALALAVGLASGLK
ncbi:MAG: hypothetical protein C5B52_06035 [Bacteroidetes bacterium]|nr:MAG: hypothetical protein C5B52_06035 [Bacteroidota bacterium]